MWKKWGGKGRRRWGVSRAALSTVLASDLAVYVRCGSNSCGACAMEEPKCHPKP